MNTRRQQFRKHLLTGIAALTLATGAFAAPAAPDGGPAHDKAPTPEMRAKSEERMAKRQTELHDKLKLSSSQEAAWTKFSNAMKPGTPSARPDREKIEKLTAPERMDAMLAVMKEHQQKMEVRTAAVKEFYAVLSPEQQKTFNDQFKHMHGHDGHRGHHGGPRPQ